MVSHDPKVDRILSSETTHYQMEYTLPDGSLINIGRERFEAAEVLFTPSICNLDFPGIPELVFNTIKVISFYENFNRKVMLPQEADYLRIFCCQAGRPCSLDSQRDSNWRWMLATGITSKKQTMMT
jgi:hypothetical protein